LKDEAAKTCRVVGNLGGFGAGRTEVAGYPWAPFRRPRDPAARPAPSSGALHNYYDI
jgi:hypothetical protein